MRSAAPPRRRQEDDTYRLRRALRAELTRLIAKGQRAAIFREGDPQALATLILAGLDVHLSAAEADGGSQGGDAAVSDVPI